MPRYYALIPAAGSGSRFGAETPKQYLNLLNKPLIYHALLTLCRCADVAEVWVAISPGDAWWASFDWSALGAKLRMVRCGGATRSETVSNTLKLMDQLSDQDWVLVHDAVRPCLSAENLARLCAELADDAVGGLLAAPLADTLKRSDAEQRVIETLPRDALWQAQTPQMFRYGLLRSALSSNHLLTDEASAIETLGLKPRLVRADASNLKVTFPADLRLAEWILKGRET